MRSHQAVILENLTEYLSLNYQKNFLDKGLEIPIEFKNILEVLKRGHCFGFSVVHASMDSVHRLIWWEYVLELIETWDKNPDSLTQKISERPDFKRIREPLLNIIWEKANTTGWENTLWGYTFTASEIEELENLEKTTLGDLFERAANYIIHQHATQTIFLPKGLEQANLLDPDREFFDIVSPDGRILKIQDRKMPAAGHLKEDVLNTVLADAAFRHDPQLMCLIHSATHAIRVGMHGNRWFVYNPNYKRDDSSANFKYLRYFDDKLAAIKEIVRIQSQDMAITMATTSSIPILVPELGIQGETKDISVKYLIILAKYFPKELKKLVKESLKDVASSETQHLRSQFVKALKEQDKRGRTGLYMIASRTPNSLEDFIPFLTIKDDTYSDLQARLLKL